MKECPYCKEWIETELPVCPHCHFSFELRRVASDDEIRLASKSLTMAERKELAYERELKLTTGFTIEGYRITRYLDILRLRHDSLPPQCVPLGAYLFHRMLLRLVYKRLHTERKTVC